nr:hypothetical protein [Tanacetum cinerariifolium]
SLELLMKGSGKTLERRKEDMFDEYERFQANGNESIQAYFIRFHKLVNDMKVTQIDLPKHQMNTKFVNNLPAYWSKYVTHIKNVMNMSADNYVDIFTHLRTYEPHALKSLKKLEQSSSSDDAKAEAFLADVECTAPYEGQLAMTTTNMFQANHEDAYDSDVDDGPDASIAFMANFSSACSPSSSNNISIN